LKPSSYALRRITTLSEGRILESDGDYRDAASRYAQIDVDDDLVETRKELAQIKAAIQDERTAEALDSAVSTFGSTSLLANAVRAIDDAEIFSKRSHGDFPSEQLVQNTEATEQQLQALVSLYVSTTEFQDFMQTQIRLCLLAL
jgi:lipopolysaccharide biosynthesis regulator YciM